MTYEEIIEALDNGRKVTTKEWNKENKYLIKFRKEKINFTKKNVNFNLIVGNEVEFPEMLFMMQGNKVLYEATFNPEDLTRYDFIILKENNRSKIENEYEKNILRTRAIKNLDEYLQNNSIDTLFKVMGKI